ncbi:hypothetical protein PSTT_02309 [Puccinia striiformis]|nr:hypothetical protein PSTT_02309 [Puccinia striiformis]
MGKTKELIRPALGRPDTTKTFTEYLRSQILKKKNTCFFLRPVQGLVGPACPSSSRTRPSDRRSDSAVRADAPAHQLLGQAGPTRGRTAKFENCSDAPVRGLIGPARPSNSFIQ